MRPTRRRSPSRRATPFVSSRARRRTSRSRRRRICAMAEAISRGGKAARTGRAGTGYDLHRLVEGRPLILGGVTIPFERGLAGHSDADAVCHAVTDAILGRRGRRRHRPAFSRHRSAVEGRVEHRPAAACRGHRRRAGPRGRQRRRDRDRRAAEARAARRRDARESGRGARRDRRSGQRQGKDQRRRRRAGPRRSDRGARHRPR